MRLLLGLIIVIGLLYTLGFRVGQYNNYTKGVYIEHGIHSIGYEYEGNIGFYMCMEIEGQMYC